MANARWVEESRVDCSWREGESMRILFSERKSKSHLLRVSVDVIF